MAIAERTAETTWEGSLDGGRGSIQPATGAFDALPVTSAPRTEHRDAKTSPEELAAAAHSACFAMPLARHLGEHQVVSGRLTVAATVTLDEAGGVPAIVSSALRVRGQLPGLDAAGFQAVVGEAAGLCPVSWLFAGAKITVEAELEQGA